MKIYSIFSLYDNYANKKAFFSYSFMSALRKWMSHNQMSLCSLYNEFAWIQMRFASYHRSLLIRNDKMRFHVQRLPACPPACLSFSVPIKTNSHVTVLAIWVTPYSFNVLLYKNWPKCTRLFWWHISKAEHAFFL